MLMSKLIVLYTIEMPLTCKPWALPHSRWPRDDMRHSQRLELVTLKIALECLLKTFFGCFVGASVVVGYSLYSLVNGDLSGSGGRWQMVRLRTTFVVMAVAP